MTKKYFIVINKRKEGPLSLDQLEGKLYPDTLIWYDGLDDWKRAEEVQELECVITKLPPPIPKKEYVPNKVDNWFDKNFTNKNVKLGFIVFLISFIASLCKGIYDAYSGWKYYVDRQLALNNSYDGLLEYFFFNISFESYLLEAFIIMVIFFAVRWVYINNLYRKYE